MAAIQAAPDYGHISSVSICVVSLWGRAACSPGFLFPTGHRRSLSAGRLPCSDLNATRLCHPEGEGSPVSTGCVLADNQHGPALASGRRQHTEGAGEAGETGEAGPQELPPAELGSVCGPEAGDRPPEIRPGNARCALFDGEFKLE